INADGNIKNEFLPFDSDYNTRKDAKEKQPLAAINTDGALSLLQVIPHGENLLLFPKMTAQAVIEVNEEGIVRTVQLHLPPRQTLSSFLSADASSWRIKSFALAESKTDGNGMSYGVLREGSVFEFNPYDGSVIRKIDMPKDSNATVVCEHNGDYLALTTDAKTGRLEILKGYISR
ncbi:MAG TPA: hypothetical protein VHT24_13570, partial [Pseudacidobacterium sp.]|nr:hypothetical protein [Pseudacidobacterium sp.]